MRLDKMKLEWLITSVVKFEMAPPDFAECLARIKIAICIVIDDIAKCTTAIFVNYTGAKKLPMSIMEFASIPINSC